MTRGSFGRSSIKRSSTETPANVARVPRIDSPLHQQKMLGMNCAVLLEQQLGQLHQRPSLALGIIRLEAELPFAKGRA